MRALLRLPLHFQILIALILGTAVGIAVNPGDVPLEETITATATVDPEGSISVEERTDGGELLIAEQFPDRVALENRYPDLAKQLQASLEAEIEVAEPRAHIVDDGSKITLRYMRQQNGRPVVTSLSSTDELPAYWTRVIDDSASLGRTVGVWARRVGDLFLRLLKMITIPLIVTSLITGVAGLGQTSRFGSMFGRTLLYYASTSVLAITVGIVMVNLVQPGVGATLPGGGEALHGGDQSLAGVFLGLLDNMIPTNPVKALASGDFLAIITFSILTGVFIIYTGGSKAETLREFFEAAFAVMMRMTMAVIRLAPVGVLAFMVYATATQGFEIFRTLAWYMLTVFLALVVHACVVLPLIVKFVARRSPLEFARAMSPALMTAFSTASSNATLPLTLTNVEGRAGVSNRTSSFVLPLGATINMDGTALYEAVAVLFIAQATPGVDLTLGTQIVVALTALMASVGAAGIPHAGLVMMAIVLQAVGLPLEAQGVIIAVDRVLDMCRTSVNVWSDSCGCAVIDHFDSGDIADASD